MIHLESILVTIYLHVISSIVSNYSWSSKREGMYHKGVLLMFLEIIISQIYMVPMIWWMWYRQLGTYIKGKRWLTWSSKSSRYLRVKVYFFSPSQSLDQFLNERGGG